MFSDQRSLGINNDVVVLCVLYAHLHVLCVYGVYA